MTLEQIFDESGLYVSDSFQDGLCFEIDKNYNLLIKHYNSPDDLFPTISFLPIYKELFSKNYKKVLTIKSLFKNKYVICSCCGNHYKNLNNHGDSCNECATSQDKIERNFDKF